MPMYMEQLVDVYKNLHNGLWSILDRKTRLVVGHAKEVYIQNPQFVVQPAGRQRVLDKGRKNVHAFVRGELVSWNTCHHAKEGPSITYNPYKFGTFVQRDNEKPIHKAQWAHLNENGVMVNDEARQ